jgi:rod shape-determining protein MreD
MKQFLIYLFFAYLAMSVQAVFFKGTKPDFVLVLVCFYSLRYGQIKGAAYGALTGLLVDTVSGFVLGPNIISKSVAGFLISTIRTKLFQWNIVANTLVIAIFSVIDIFLVYICIETFSQVSFSNRSWDLLIMQTIYTIGAAMILYALLNPVKDNTG